jgi:Ca2+-binding RTX toxin-like protein
MARALLLAAAALAVPASASAATVSAENGRIMITAKPGETNTMTFNEGDGSYQITDSASPIEAGANCVKAPDAQRVGCPATGATVLMADLGDGDDSLTVSAGLGSDVEGGAGNDTIVGGFGDDVIRGGAGNDGLDGNTGNDTLKGADGDDFMSGGAGPDSLEGGDGNDNLNGNEDGDTIVAGDGKDTLAGNDGNDRLEAGKGADGLDGGDGDDVLRTGDGEFRGTRETRIRCGAGSDSVTSGPNDPFVSDCERTDGASIRLRKRGRIPLVLVCAQPSDCEGRVTLRDSRRKLVERARFDVGAGATGTVAARLSPAQTRRLFRKKKVRLTATFAIAFPKHSVRATFTLLRRV